MSEVITEINFMKPHQLATALQTMMEDAHQLGHHRVNIEFAPGVAMLVEDILTDGSKVARIVIAQVQS